MLVANSPLLLVPSAEATTTLSYPCNSLTKGIGLTKDAQVEYCSNYTGSGTITYVVTDLDGVPSVSSAGPDAYLSLNTGDFFSCTEFMQVGIYYNYSYGVWQPDYNNGDSHPCGGLTGMSGITTISTGDTMQFEIGNDASKGTTQYIILDNTNGESTNLPAQTNVGQTAWGYDSFMTMGETYGQGTSVGSTSFEDSLFGDPNSNNVYITTNSNSVTTPTAFGSACSDSYYSLDSWDNNNYGYTEPSFTVGGSCVYNATATFGGSTGIVDNPGNFWGGPESGVYATVNAPNSGDWAYITGDFGQTFYSGDVKILLYSPSSYNTLAYIAISSDGSTWTTTNKTIGTLPTSPTWYDIGTVADIGAVHYVRIYVADNATNNDDSSHVYVYAAMGYNL
jgi:hypothetical protein